MAAPELPAWAVPAGLAALFSLLVLLEIRRPARAAQRGRWPVNLALGLLNAALVRVLGIAAPLAAAGWAAASGIGLFNWLAAPPWAEAAAVIVAMDFAIYWQHRAFHLLPWGWALHRLHHADADFDVTTGVRFHPGEALASMLYKSLAVLLLGASPMAVLLFEAYLAAFSMIEHANVRLPARAERVLRGFWITPDVHRVHHSAHGADHDHNFGFAIGLWDRWFGTWQDRAKGPDIGLPQAGDRL